VPREVARNVLEPAGCLASTWEGFGLPRHACWELTGQRSSLSSSGGNSDACSGLSELGGNRCTSRGLSRGSLPSTKPNVAGSHTLMRQTVEVLVGEVAVRVDAGFDAQTVATGDLRQYPRNQAQLRGRRACCQHVRAKRRVRRVRRVPRLAKGDATLRIPSNLSTCSGST
jgi:hypothetical protein